MASDEQTLTANKAVVARFNKEVIERGDQAAFRELMAPDFINRSAPPGMPNGAPTSCRSSFTRCTSTARPITPWRSWAS
jgi:hypothetical protein